MTRKYKIVLISSAGALLILFVAFWFLVLQPNQQNQAKQSEELLSSGIRLFNEKKFNETLDTLARIPSGAIQEAKARYYQGSASMMLKDFESAVEYLGQAHRLNSQDTAVLYALGVAYYKLGNVKLAKSYFSSVVEINPQDEQAKGLLDIMAKLERNQSGESASGSDETLVPEAQ